MAKNPIDEHVGRKIRLLRETRRVNDKSFAELVGIPDDKIEQYESGRERVATIELLRIAATFSVGIAYFFDGLGGSSVYGAESSLREIPSQDETLELVTAFSRIRDPTSRRKIIQMATSLAAVTEIGQLDSSP